MKRSHTGREGRDLHTDDDTEFQTFSDICESHRGLIASGLEWQACPAEGHLRDWTAGGQSISRETLSSFNFKDTKLSALWMPGNSIQVSVFIFVPGSFKRAQ